MSSSCLVSWGDEVEEFRRRGPGHVWNITTVSYRAPEVLYRAAVLTPSIDVWSLGIVLAEMAGSPITLNVRDPKLLGDSWAAVLGSPVPDATDNWQAFEAPAEARQLRFWPTSTKATLGMDGQELVGHMLQYSSRRRITVQAALNHVFFTPDVFPLCGVLASRVGLRPTESPSLGACLPQGDKHTPTEIKDLQLRPACDGDITLFTGSRHSWNMRAGQLSGEVLQWLLADPCFRKGSPQNEILQAVLDGRETRRGKVEEGRKVIVSGHVGSSCTSSMCNLSLDQPIPSATVVTWLKAFRKVNEKPLLALENKAKSSVSKLGRLRHGNNGVHFLKTPLEEWFLTCAELVVADGSGRGTGTPWAEPAHQDGGMSIFHMGLTLAGCRDLVCQQGPGRASVVLRNVPGTVYFGQLTGPTHQVFHVNSAPDDKVDCTSLGPASVTVMFRTGLFPYYRSRMRSRIPDTPALFAALASSFVQGLVTEEFRLPTLAECLAEFPLGGLSPAPAAAFLPGFTVAGEYEQALTQKPRREVFRKRMKGPGRSVKTAILKMRRA